MNQFRALILDDRGAAAAEMAMVAPLLLVIMFSSLELGKYFWDEHIVLKSVRDGARFASRQSFASMPCGGPAANEDQIKNLVRYGVPVVTTETPRMAYWDSNSTITVTITCYANAGASGARVYNGIYSARAQVPVVNVSATVPYTPIASMFGFRGTGLSLNGASEATVYGI